MHDGHEGPDRRHRHKQEAVHLHTSLRFRSCIQTTDPTGHKLCAGDVLQQCHDGDNASNEGHHPRHLAQPIRRRANQGKQNRQPKPVDEAATVPVHRRNGIAPNDQAISARYSHRKQEQKIGSSQRFGQQSRSAIREPAQSKQSQCRERQRIRRFEAWRHQNCNGVKRKCHPGCLEHEHRIGDQQQQDHVEIPGHEKRAQAEHRGKHQDAEQAQGLPEIGPGEPAAQRETGAAAHRGGRGHAGQQGLHRYSAFSRRPGRRRRRANGWPQAWPHASAR